MLNQTPIRGQRLNNAANTLGDEAALDIADVVAQPFIVMRNDHQDALRAGLAVSEYAPASKSADEIRGLWQWVEGEIGIAVAGHRNRRTICNHFASLFGCLPAGAVRLTLVVTAVRNCAWSRKPSPPVRYCYWAGTG